MPFLRSSPAQERFVRLSPLALLILSALFLILQEIDLRGDHRCTVNAYYINNSWTILQLITLFPVAHSQILFEWHILGVTARAGEHSLNHPPAKIVAHLRGGRFAVTRILSLHVSDHVTVDSDSISATHINTSTYEKINENNLHTYINTKMNK